MRPKRARSEAPRDLTVRAMVPTGPADSARGRARDRPGGGTVSRCASPTRVAVRAARAAPAAMRRRGRGAARALAPSSASSPPRSWSATAPTRFAALDALGPGLLGRVGAPSSSATRSSGSSPAARRSRAARGPRRRVRPVRRARRSSTPTARSRVRGDGPGPARCSSARVARRAPTARGAPRRSRDGDWRTSLDRDDFEARVERDPRAARAPASATR